MGNWQNILAGLAFLDGIMSPLQGATSSAVAIIPVIFLFPIPPPFSYLLMATAPLSHQISTLFYFIFFFSLLDLHLSLKHRESQLCFWATSRDKIGLQDSYLSLLEMKIITDFNNIFHFPRYRLDET